MNRKPFNLEYELVLSLLVGDSHGRALSARLGVPLTTVQLTLREMAGKNILEYTPVGRNKIYSLKRTLQARQAVYSAEHYKLTKLIEHYQYLSPLIQDILKLKESGMIIIFGSYARFAAKKESDIDLFVESESLKVKKELESLNSSLSVKIGRFSREDLLIREIIKNHIIIRGVEEYYERLGFFG
jgi:predicted nucleotidyltransferase